MELKDFQIGKWYTNSDYINCYAIKFFNIVNNNLFFSEVMYINGKHEYKKAASGYTLSKFSEVSILDLIDYLPKTHPDLQDLYLKAVVNESTYIIKDFIYKYSRKDTNSIIVTSNIPTGKYNPSTYLWCNKKSFTVSTKEEYNNQLNKSLGLNFDNELSEFPEEGYCECKGEQIVLLVNYLTTSGRDTKNFTFTPQMIGIAWNKNNFWDIQLNSSKAPYTIEQLNKYININQINHGQTINTTNWSGEICNSTSENTTTSRPGTVAIRCGGQQITVGNRPKGNSTSANIGETQIRGIKISKSIIQRENY